MKILVINAGSSSIKYQLFDMTDQSVLAAGLVERIGEEVGRIKHNNLLNPAIPPVNREMSIPDHQTGLRAVAALLLDANTGVIAAPEEITAVGHRVVHGGEKFSAPTVINDEVLAVIETLSALAPLHNPANLSGIRVAMNLFPQAPQVAIFDTAFHQTMPAYAYRYAIPTALYEREHIRVYGFHGTSHLYVSKAAAAHLGKRPEETNLITAHLGNGASITAVSGGKSVDTSMGFSPLPGLIMGTRSGDLDPAIIFHLAQQGMSIPEIDKMLNKKSGLLGLSGDNDLRDIERRLSEGDPVAELAFEMYTYRIKKYIGMYTAVLGHVDALVFTAGVGENSALVRQQTCTGLENLGYTLDFVKNMKGKQGKVTEIQTEDSHTKILIVPTNEELEIALQTEAVLKG
ncbi:MAG: acetate kinase [Anaerolineales bacterium]|nr:acetate kinase [Anaerolineales bacterium]